MKIGGKIPVVQDDVELEGEITYLRPLTVAFHTPTLNVRRELEVYPQPA